MAGAHVFEGFSLGLGLIKKIFIGREKQTKQNQRCLF